MFDVLTVAAVADELADTVLDGRIQKIGLVDKLTFAAEIYAGGERHNLVASADTDDGRIYLAERLPSFDPALVTPFGLLLRKYVRGGVVVGVEQPPLERVIRLSIAKHFRPNNAKRATATTGADAPVEDDVPDDDPEVDEEGEADAVFVHLVVEIMGRHGNLILVGDDGRIMEGAKHVTPKMSRVRPIWPRLVYTPPPPIDKPDPRRLTGAEAEILLGGANPNGKLADLLVKRLRAISPQMAREIAFRTARAPDATVAPVATTDDGALVLARETRALFEPLLTSAWAPAVYLDRKTEEPIAFAALPLGHLAAVAEEESTETISAAVERARDADGGAMPVDHLQRRARLVASILAARDKLGARLASIAQQERRAAEADRLRTRGELIYAYLWQIEPGQAELQVDGERIPLDPTLSAKANAQDYFERYRKAQGAAGTLPALREQAEHEVAYLDQLRTMVEQATGFAELEALAHEWGAQRAGSGDETKGGKSGKGGKERSVGRGKDAGPKRPKPLLDADGNAIFIGHSGRQNDLVTFDIAGPDDTWLHARGTPGSHVVVRWRSPRADEDPETIAAAAALAAHYSAARDSGTVEVDVTRRKHVRKIKGAGPGMVTYRQERTLAVRPLAETALGEVLTPAS